jgi:hypothetical protein
VIRPWRVDAFGVVDLGAGSATRLVPVAFAFALAVLAVRSVTIDCRMEEAETYRHATHAVETQRLLEGSSSSCKACFFRLRCLGLGAWIAPDVAWWPTESCARFCDMIIHVQLPRLSRHVQHLLGDEDNARGAADRCSAAIERAGSTIGAGRRLTVTRWRCCETALIDGSSLLQQAELSHVCLWTMADQDRVLQAPQWLVGGGVPDPDPPSPTPPCAVGHPESDCRSWTTLRMPSDDMPMTT